MLLRTWSICRTPISSRHDDHIPVGGERPAAFGLSPPLRPARRPCWSDRLDAIFVVSPALDPRGLLSAGAGDRQGGVRGEPLRAEPPMSLTRITEVVPNTGNDLSGCRFNRRFAPMLAKRMPRFGPAIPLGQPRYLVTAGPRARTAGTAPRVRGRASPSRASFPDTLSGGRTPARRRFTLIGVPTPTKFSSRCGSPRSQRRDQLRTGVNVASQGAAGRHRRRRTARLEQLSQGHVLGRARAQTTFPWAGAAGQGQRAYWPVRRRLPAALSFDPARRWPPRTRATVAWRDSL